MVKLPKRFSVGERVFAKVRGYPPWPAKIENITDPNSKQAKYHVVFFGTKEIGTCKIEDLFLYSDNKDKFSKSVRRKYFHEGIQELEEDLKKNPNPVSESSKDLETSENVPENVGEDIPEKDNEIAAPANAEGDVDTGNLVIDEGDKKKAVKRKSQIPPASTPDVSEAKKKRGRKSMATILAENTPKQEAAHDSQDEDSEKKNVSRSGRKIKPKRFHDSEADQIPIEPSKPELIERKRTKGKAEESNENQESPVAPIKKRMSVEKDEKKVLAKDEAEVQKDLKLRKLRTESHIAFLDTQIRSNLGLEQANVDECLDAMNQMLELPITPLMLKKHSHIVEAIKRLRRYVGNLTDWNYTDDETAVFKQKADEIKKKAEKIYNKFKSLFTIPEGQTFWNTFVEELEEFRKITKDMTQEEIFSLIDDPTESVKSVKNNDESSTDITSPVKSDAATESVSNKNESVIEPENN